VTETNQATHRCKVCGALWSLTVPEMIEAEPEDQEEYWQLISPTCGTCCDNVPMSDQLEKLP